MRRKDGPIRIKHKRFYNLVLYTLCLPFIFLEEVVIDKLLPKVSHRNIPGFWFVDFVLYPFYEPYDWTKNANLTKEEKALVAKVRASQKAKEDG